MTIRGDAYQSLPPTEEVAALRDRHAEFFRTFTRRARDAQHTAERETWLDLLEAEVDNIRAALAWSLETGDTAAMDIAASSFGLWRRGRWTEGRMWLSRSLAGATDPSATRLEALLVLGTMARSPERDDLARAALRLARELADERLLVDALVLYGSAITPDSRLSGSPEGRTPTSPSVAAYREAIEVGARIGGAEPRVAEAMRLLGWQALFLDGDSVAARRFHDEAHRLLRNVPGLVGALGDHLAQHSTLLFHLGDREGARTLLEEQSELVRGTSLERSLPSILLNLADTQLELGHPEEARTLWLETIALARARSVPTDAVRANLRLAGLALRNAELEEAQRRLDEAQSEAEQLPDAKDEFPQNLPLMSRLQALLAEHRGDAVAAQAWRQKLESALSDIPAVRSGFRAQEAESAHRHGDKFSARRLYREALDLIPEDGPHEARVLEIEARLAEVDDDLDRAWDLIRRLEASLQVAAIPRMVVSRAAALARLALRRRDVAAVREALEPALAVATYPSDVAELGLLRARAAFLGGHPGEAVAILEELLPQWPEVGDAFAWVEFVETRALALIHTGKLPRGAELLGLADAERERIVYPRLSEDAVDIEAAVAVGRAAVGEEAFDRARGRGRVMDIRTELWKEAGR